MPSTNHSSPKTEEISSSMLTSLLSETRKSTNSFQSKTYTSMISMAEVGYDTCPMEGYDSVRIKAILGLPDTAEINMVIGCGIRAENGIYGDQFRLPLETVYFEK